MIPAAALLAALVLLVTVLQDAFEVMLLPRRVTRRVRLARLYFRGAWSGWRHLAMLVPAGERRIRILGTFGPLSMVVLFMIWATLLIVGFGLIDWALECRLHPAPTLASQFYLSGVSFFTLGYGDVVPRTGATRALAVLESGTGLGFIAVVIGYLPVLYQLFARREAHVIQLDTRAGTPPTAATILARHAELDGLPSLDDLLAQWETWGAELLESHLSYPMLSFYRSQHDDQSWLAALAAIMDACAIVLVGLDAVPKLQARMTFTMGRGVIVEMCRGLHIHPSHYDGGDRLPPETFGRLDEILGASGLRWGETADADPAETLLALRATYEPLLDGLARLLLLPLPPFVPDDAGADHWERGHRGMIARRLVAQLTAADATAAPRESGRLGQRVRRRLDRKP